MGQYTFKLPDVGEGTAEAEIGGWRVNVGDRVEEDQPLVDMMTDKATVELTSPVAGVVKSIAGKAGEKAAVGSVLVVLETSDSAASNEASVSEKAAPAAPVQPAAQMQSAIASAQLGGAKTASSLQSAPLNAILNAPQANSLSTNTSAVSGASIRGAASRVGNAFARPPASPAVRRRAEELGIKLQFVIGSGPGGRIMHTDLDAHRSGDASVAATPSAGPYAKRAGVVDVPVIGLRRQIAERMQLSKRQIPHFTYVEEIDVTELEALRARLNETRLPGQPKLTLLPFFIRALVRVLPEFPQINATFDDDAGVVHRSAPVHLGMAVQTARGLLVAVVKHAEARDLWDCAAEISRLATVARDGKATRDELTGSTITLSSLGALGGVSATPVINRPEVAIIGPNKIIRRPIVRDDDQIVIRSMMNLSSSFDHRVVDGADAAEFIQRLRSLLEHPATIFV